MLENDIDNRANKERDENGFYYEDYYNTEFDEYGFNKAGIYLKKGYSYNRGDADIENYHKYAYYCRIELYTDYIIVHLAYFASDSVKNKMLHYGWKYYPRHKFWINKIDNLDYEKFIRYLQHEARNQTFISLEKYDENFQKDDQHDNAYDLLGYDEEGYDREGFNRQGIDRRGYNKNGFNIAGYNKRGESWADFACFLIKEVLLSPQQIEDLSYGILTRAETIDYKTHTPVRGGLFCENIFGTCESVNNMTHSGIKYRSLKRLSAAELYAINKMGVIHLCCKVVNPWFFHRGISALSLLTGFSYEDLSKIIHYKKYLVLNPGDSHYKKHSIITPQEFQEVEIWNTNYDIQTGAEAIYQMVSTMDLQKMLLILEEEIKTPRSANFYKDVPPEFFEKLEKSRIHNIQNRINVVNAFIKSGKNPTWMFLDKLPIIPLDLRPYTLYEDGRYACHTINDLYRKVISKILHANSYFERCAPNIIMHGVLSELQKTIDVLFDNSNCDNPVMTDFMIPCKSLKDIFFDRNGLFLDLLNGCDAKKNDFVIRENKCVLYIGIDEDVIIPPGVTSIENSAFLDCKKVRSIHVPESVEFISPTAFKTCENLTIHAPKGSFAEKYSKENSISFVIE